MKGWNKNKKIKFNFTVLIITLFLVLPHIACSKHDRHNNKKIEYLINRLNHKDRDVREAAAFRAGNYKDSRVVDALIHALKDNEISVQLEAIRSLVKIGDARAVDPLLFLLNSENEDVRNNAIRALGKIGAPGTVDTLISIIKDRDEYELSRIAAADALAHIGSPAGIDAIIEALRDFRLRYISSEFGIFNEKDEYAVNALNKAMKDEDRNLRIGAIYAIHAMVRSLPLPYERTEADKEIAGRLAEPVIERLRDKDELVIRKAIAVLSALEIDTAVNGLINSLYREKDWKLRKRAARALLNIKKISEYEPSTAAKIEKESKARLKFLPKEEGKKWIEIEPVGCGDHPWEIDWYKLRGISWFDSHGINNNGFVPYKHSAGKEYTVNNRDYAYNEHLEMSEDARMQIWKIEKIIIKDFFAEHGIDIVDMRSIATFQLLDEELMYVDCVDVRYFFLQIYDKDVDKMISAGYELAKEQVMLYQK